MGTTFYKTVTTVLKKTQIERSAKNFMTSNLFILLGTRKGSHDSSFHPTAC